MKRRILLRKLLWGLATLALLIFLTILYSKASWRLDNNSDNATAVLQAISFLHGNWLLHGWLLGVDPNVAIEMPLYGVGILARGVGASVMHDVPGAIFAGCVLLAVGLSAFEWRSRWTAVITGASAFVVVGLISPQSRYTTDYFFLQGPIHVGTLLAVLTSIALAVAGAHRPSRRLLLGCVAAAVIALALTNDPLALVTGGVPWIAVALVGTLKGDPRLRAYGPILVGSALGGLVLWRLILTVIRLLGGYYVPPAGSVFVDIHTLPQNILHAVHGLLSLFGANIFGQPMMAVSTLSRLMHLAVLIICLSAVVAFVNEWLRGRTSDTIGVLASVSFLSAFGSYLVYPIGSDMASTRYISCCLAFGGIALARRVGMALDAKSWAAKPRFAAVVAGSLVAVVAYCGAFVSWMRRPPTHESRQVLASFLLSHDLTLGLGDYWDANIVTVLTHGQVRVVPVVANGGKLEQRYNTSSSWYAQNPCHNVSTCRVFVVWGNGGRQGEFQLGDLVKSFGAPVHVYRIPAPSGRPYRVAVWNEDLFSKVVRGYHSD